MTDILISINPAKRAIPPSSRTILTVIAAIASLASFSWLSPAQGASQAAPAPAFEWPKEPAPPPGAPNIVIILLDDIGFGDTSAFGGPADTPFLKDLADGGLRFVNFHTTGICSPTRAALLSGRNAHHMGFGGIGESPYPGYAGVWRKSTASIAQVLQMNGYATAAFGKWHNTPSLELTPIGPFNHWPTSLGFDYFFGNMIGMSSQFEPTLWRNTYPTEPDPPEENSYHLTANLVDDAIKWLHAKNSIDPAKPYFLYFATGAAHAPHHAPQKWIDRYDGRFVEGWDEAREKTFVAQKAMGILPDNATLTPRPPEIAAWNSLSENERRVHAREMQVYAGFISHTDYEVGRLLQAIQESGDADNTVIFYIVGDNGGEPVAGPDGAEDLVSKVAGVGPQMDERLDRLNELGGPLHINVYSAGWAWAGVAPFRWMKFVSSHLGATRNPMVVSWPKNIQSAGIRRQFGHVIDIAPTIYDIAGVKPPDKINGEKQEPFDGASLVEVIRNPSAPAPRDTQYFEALGNRAIYHDGWMASARHTTPWIEYPWLVSGDRLENDVWELYDLDSDFSQAFDVAGEYPKKLDQMKTLFAREARKNDVYPLGVSVGQKRPKRSAGRTHFVYYGDFPGVPLSSGAAPDFLKSSTIEVELTLPKDGGDGAVFAAGGRSSGFALYMRGGRLFLENNFLNRERDVLSTDALKSGSHRIRLDLDVTPKDGAPPAAAARLYVDGVFSQSGEFKRFSPPDPLDNLDISQDAGEPVSNAYAPPFKFNGKVGKASVTIR